jgi:hypothetical protein
MLEEITLSKGSDLSPGFCLSLSRRDSALIASSPRTAYSTLRRAGLSESTVRGRIIEDGEDDVAKKCREKMGRKTVSGRLGVLTTIWESSIYLRVCYLYVLNKKETAPSIGA